MKVISDNWSFAVMFLKFYTDVLEEWWSAFFLGNVSWTFEQGSGMWTVITVPSESSALEEQSIVLPSEKREGSELRISKRQIVLAKKYSEKLI